MQTPVRQVQESEPYFLENPVGSKPGYFQDITLADGSIVQRLTTPRTQSCLWIQDSARFKSWKAALESPTACRFGAIQPEVIASYPQEWLDGLSSGIYDMIPSWQEWHNGVLPVWSTREEVVMEWPVPHPSSPCLPAGPIEQPVFEGPRRSDRVRQQ